PADKGHRRFLRENGDGKDFAVVDILVGQTLSVDADRYHWRLGCELEHGIDDTAVEFVILFRADYAHTVT
ncbi:unnamed protein product, partial [marine sediment metagenome]